MQVYQGLPANQPQLPSAIAPYIESKQVRPSKNSQELEGGIKLFSRVEMETRVKSLKAGTTILITETDQIAFTEHEAQWGKGRWRGFNDLTKFMHFAAWLGAEKRDVKLRDWTMPEVRTAFQHDMVLSWVSNKKNAQDWEGLKPEIQALFEKAGIGKALFTATVATINPPPSPQEQPLPLPPLHASSEGLLESASSSPRTSQPPAQRPARPPGLDTPAVHRPSAAEFEEAIRASFASQKTQ